MQKSFYLLSILFLAGCVAGNNPSNKNKKAEVASSTKAQLKTAKGKTIGFYNVENLFDTIDDQYTIDEWFLPESETQWNTEKYLKKLNDLAKVISHLNEDYPVFLGLCEIENKQVIQDLVQTDDLKKANYQIVHQDSPDKRGIDVGFIYRPDYFKLHEFEALNVSLPDDEDFFTRDIYHISGELADNDSIHIFINHWSSRRGGWEETQHKRVRAATIVRNKVDEILAQNAQAKIVIMGDFNDHPDNKSIYETLRAKETTDFENGNLYNTAYSLHASKKGTYNYKGEWGMLDQLIVSQGMYKAKKGISIAHETCSILKLDWMLYTDPKYGDKKPNKTYGGPNYYGGYSDHLPIYMELK